MNHRNDPDPVVSLLRLLLTTPANSMEARPHLGQPRESKGEKVENTYYESEPDEEDYYHSAAAHYTGDGKGKSNRYHRDKSCKRGARIRDENIR